MTISLRHSIVLTSLAVGAASSTACTAPVGGSPAGDDAVSSSAALSGCYSSISAKYDSLGGASSFLGQPAGIENASPDGVGRFRAYENGAIYWSPSTCAWSVTGGILQEWGSLGWELGMAGYPVSDEVNAPDNYGRVSYFQHASIYWSPGSGAWAVSGWVRDRWLALGGVNSAIGYPTGDIVNGGAQAGIVATQTFEDGAIYVTSSTDRSKTYAVYGAIGHYYDSLGGPYGAAGRPTSNEATCAVIGAWARCQSFAHAVMVWTASGGVRYNPY